MDKYFIHFDQEGNFLGRYVSAHSEIPSDAVEVSQSLFHQTIDETDGVWKIDRKTGEIAKHPFPPAPELTFAERRAIMLSEATSKRWEVMTGGLTLPGGVEVGTTIDDQNRITSVVANAALAGLTDSDEVDFKATNGWVRITIGQVKEIAGAIGQFVQACYSAERQHHEAIALLDPGDFDTYDLEAHWPPSNLTEPAA